MRSGPGLSCAPGGGEDFTGGLHPCVPTVVMTQTEPSSDAELGAFAWKETYLPTGSQAQEKTGSSVLQGQGHLQTASRRRDWARASPATED